MATASQLWIRLPQQGIALAPSFVADFQGPQFDVEGLRDMLDVHDRPIIFGVIKPNVGLLPEPFAADGGEQVGDLGAEVGVGVVDGQIEGIDSLLGLAHQVRQEGAAGLVYSKKESG